MNIDHLAVLQYSAHGPGTTNCAATTAKEKPKDCDKETKVCQINWACWENNKHLWSDVGKRGFRLSVRLFGRVEWVKAHRRVQTLKLRPTSHTKCKCSTLQCSPPIV